jgi:hypothetical protein
LKIFQNGATNQDSGFFPLNFLNFGKNQRINNFWFCKLFLIQKYYLFLVKINGWRRNQNDGQQLKWLRIDFFISKIETKAYQLYN